MCPNHTARLWRISTAIPILLKTRCPMGLTTLPMTDTEPLPFLLAYLSAAKSKLLWMQDNGEKKIPQALVMFQLHGCLQIRHQIQPQLLQRDLHRSPSVGLCVCVYMHALGVHHTQRDVSVVLHMPGEMLTVAQWGYARQQRCRFLWLEILQFKSCETFWNELGLFKVMRIYFLPLRILVSKKELWSKVFSKNLDWLFWAK